jgi:hypothetical protein
MKLRLCSPSAHSHYGVSHLGVTHLSGYSMIGCLGSHVFAARCTRLSGRVLQQLIAGRSCY